MKQKRLSLADFKMNKIESKNEIDKLMGGAAASCHGTHCPAPITGDWNDPLCDDNVHSQGFENSAQFINNGDGTTGYSPEIRK